MDQVKLLRRLMKAKRLNEIKLATESGVDSSLIYRYLNEDESERVAIGKRNAPRLAKALGVSVVELLYGKRAAA